MSKTMAEVIREELRKGSYQMPGDTLPYETQANAIAARLTAAGFGLMADAMEIAFDYGWREGKGWPTPSDIESGELHHGQAQRAPFNPYRAEV